MSEHSTDRRTKRLVELCWLLFDVDDYWFFLNQLVAGSGNLFVILCDRRNVVPPDQVNQGMTNDCQ